MEERHLLAWKDLKEDPKDAAFERKNNGESHWINDKTPELILNKSGSLAFGKKPIPESQKPIPESRETSLRNDGDCTLGSWSDLLSNPKQWWDCRSKKLNGLVKPNSPDFKHKEGGRALWLVLSELEGVDTVKSIEHSNQRHNAPKTEKKNVFHIVSAYDQSLKSKYDSR
ncbi:hypothetical protein ACFX2A_004591 [Malus domestica]